MKTEITARITELLKDKKKPKEVLALITTEYPFEGVKPHHVYGISSDLIKAGQKKSSDGSAPGSKTAGKKKGKNSEHRASDEFVILAKDELVRINDEITRLTRMAAAYDKTNSEFAAHLEGKIKKEQERMAAIKEYLK